MVGEWSDLIEPEDNVNNCSLNALLVGKKKSGVYTKRVSLKVKSCNTTKNLENITMAEHQTMSKPKKLMVLNLFCCKIPCISYV